MPPRSRRSPSRPPWAFGSALPTALTLAAGVLAPAGSARAQKPEVALEVRVTPRGTLAVQGEGSAVTELSPETPPLRRGTPHAQRLDVGGHAVFELRLPVRGTEAEEVWVGEISGSGAWPVLWHGHDGARDADAEVAVHVSVDAHAIWRFQTSPAITRCDDPEPRLFPEAWDFAAHRFRSVLSPLPAAADQALTAVLGGPDVPRGPARGGFRWVAASTTLAAGGDAANLMPPRELDDDDPATAWSEGLGGDGRGEFLTARNAGGAVAVHGIRLNLAHGEDAALRHRENRLSRFQLILGAPGALRRYDVTLPAASEPKGPLPSYWIALPEPVETACVSLVLTEVAPGRPGSSGKTSLTAVDIFTELDGADAPRKLVARLADPATCQARVPQVVAAGAAVIEPLAEALVGARGPAKACLLEAMARLPGRFEVPTAREALLASVLGATTEDERWLARAFGGHASDVVPGLTALLGRADASSADRGRAAQLLGKLGTAESRAALLPAAGLGDDQLRAAVVEAAAASGGLTGEELSAALSRATTDHARADLLRILSPLLDHLGPSPEAASWLPTLVRLAESSGDQDGVFEVRARAIAALGHLPIPGSAQALGGLIARDRDEVIRYFAIRDLIRKGPSELAAVRAALHDADPRVRETAAEGLGLWRDVGAAEALTTAAKDEGWPFARRAEVGALGRLCVPATFYLLERAVDRDSDEIARAALQGLAQCQQDGAHSLLWKKLRDEDSAPGLRELAASLLGESAGPKKAEDARALAAELPRLVANARGDAARAGVAEAALRSLAALGGEDAARVLVSVASEPRNDLRRVALEGLGQTCDASGIALLRTLAARATDPAAEVAARSLQRCARRVTTP